MKKIDSQIDKINQIILRDPGNPLKPLKPVAPLFVRNKKEIEVTQSKKLPTYNEVITNSGKLTLIDIKLENNNPMRQSNFSKLVTET